jgi:LmbE family N-acetylglucosaminyl deacetylase
LKNPKWRQRYRACEMRKFARVLDVDKFLEALGGPAEVGRMLGGERTTPYQWRHRKRISYRGLNTLWIMQAAMGKELDLSEFVKQ